MSAGYRYTVCMNSRLAMRFKPALTKDDLTEIQERSAAARAGAAHARLFRQGSSSTSLILAESLRAVLQDEPVILEQGTLP